MEKNLADLNARIAGLKKAGRPVNPNLMSQLEQVNKESLELKRTIHGNEAAMEKVREKYAADKARFKVLSGGQPNPSQSAISDLRR